MPIISEPMVKPWTPPAAEASFAMCRMKRRYDHSSVPEKVTVCPSQPNWAGNADPTKLATWLAAAPVLSGEPAWPAAGEQVMRPRQG